MILGNKLISGKKVEEEIVTNFSWAIAGNEVTLTITGGKNTPYSLSAVNITLESSSGVIPTNGIATIKGTFNRPTCTTSSLLLRVFLTAEAAEGVEKILTTSVTGSVSGEVLSFWPVPTAIVNTVTGACTVTVSNAHPKVASVRISIAGSGGSGSFGIPSSRIIDVPGSCSFDIQPGPTTGAIAVGIGVRPYSFHNLEPCDIVYTHYAKITYNHT